MFRVSVIELEESNCAIVKMIGACRSELKKTEKIEALKERIELIIFGFGSIVLTSIPLKFQKLKLPQRKFRSRFCKFVNAKAKFCSESKNLTRRLWLLVRCRNLCFNEVVPDYAFQEYISANERICEKKCYYNLKSYV